MTARIGAKGEVVIPKAICEPAGLAPGPGRIGTPRGDARAWDIASD